MVIWLIAGALGASVGSNVLTRWLVPRLEARGVLDVPNQRSLHAAAAVRGAGLAVAGTWGACFLLLMVLQQLPGLAGGFTVLGLATGLSLVGFWDDLRSLNPALR